MATITYVTQDNLKTVVSESKKYSVKVSAITVNTVENEDGSKTVTFNQNGTAVGQLELDKEKYLKDFDLVYASDPDVEPEAGQEDTRIEDPKNPGTYLAEGNYLKSIVEGGNTDGTDKVRYTKAGVQVGNMEGIPESTILDWFKGPATLTLSDGVTVITVNGEAPETGYQYMTGDVLVLTAPLTDANSKALVAITIDGEAITTDAATGVANYTLSDWDYTPQIGAVYEE